MNNTKVKNELKRGIYIPFYSIEDLKPAKVKMKIGGGAGGHNGIKSIDQHLGPDYYRLRIGIGKPQLERVVPPCPK